MKIEEKDLELFEEAVKHASELIKISNLHNRLELAENMCTNETYDFLTFNFDDDNEKENNDNIDLNVMDNNSK
jgi:hypothetical protein